MADPRRGRRRGEGVETSPESFHGRRVWLATLLDRRLLGLGILLVLTLGAIHFLQRTYTRERPALLVTPFRAGPGGPDEAFLEELTDRVATRISRLPQVRIVVLARKGESDSAADFHLTGVAEEDGGELRVRVILRRIPEGEPRQIGVARGIPAGLGAVAEEISGFVLDALADFKP